MQERIARLSAQMKKDGLTHIVLAPGASFLYLTGQAVHPSERLTLVGFDADGKRALLLPSLEADSVDRALWDNVWTYMDQGGPAAAVREFVNSLGITPTSSVGIETGNMRVFEQGFLRETGLFQTFAACDQTVMALRLYKDEDEIASIAKAANIVDRALDALVSRIRVGMTELEVASELEYQMRKLGSEGAPFGTIVASGYRGALPHGQPTEKRLAEGELLVLDYGAIVGGYAADTTRTLSLGDPGQEALKVYDVVLAAQRAGLAAVSAGVHSAIVDKAARSVIEAQGFGEYFTHRTGHGLGLDVHEFPSIGGNHDVVLRPGMVFTVEPGIYLPGKFGVRIEDDVVVTDSGKLVLTHFPKELIVL